MPDRPVFSQFNRVQKPIEKPKKEESKKEDEVFESTHKGGQPTKWASRRDARIKRKALKKRRKKGQS